MKKIILLLTTLFFFACNEDISYTTGDYFSLSETHVNFTSQGSAQSIDIINPKGDVGATITSGSDWCEANVRDNSITVSVSENILASSRIAKLQVTSGTEKIEVLVRQAQKYFSRIAAVRNPEAIAGPGKVTLKWEAPGEDNFSHVVIKYTVRLQQHVVIVDRGLMEYTVKELLNSDGEHVFTIQSVDKENDFGETVSVSALPGKLVAFRFERNPVPEFLPFHFKASDNHTTSLRVGSEYSENEQSIINFGINEQALTTYNQENGTTITLLPASAYTLPENYLFTGAANYQNLDIPLNIASLQDQKVYGLPLTITSISPSAAVISETMSTVILVYHVDDLSGWYTVDRLPNCGEGESAYPSDPAARRRYIKRTGATTWETGYLFQSYVNDENHTGGSTNTQYITIDPSTKQIHIQQNGYAVSTELNAFDMDNNELHIEYLYRDWSGWWTHERMYNRSFSK
ncbi:MAG: DUF1735 domain-containing protein [Prevotellaceae bacterium]|jgi:hypothetical protein|nr:DUF1735 domain-containing protein [Prevotellaceae bacterium]